MKEELTYIAKRYSKGKFSVDKGWKRLNIKPSLKWSGIKIAASAASLIVLTASATLLFHHYNQKENKINGSEESVTVIAPQNTVKIIDFENTPLPTVITKITEIYGVEVVNMPNNAEEYRLSLHYEGNAADLVATINEILDLELTVKK